MGDALDASTGSRRFSTMNLASGCWHIKVTTRSQEEPTFAISLWQHALETMAFKLAKFAETFSFGSPVQVEWRLTSYI